MLICKLFGHKPLTTEGAWGGTGYASAWGSAIDGIGRIHLYIMANCPRCGEKYDICNVHVPNWIVDYLSKESKNEQRKN